MGLELTTLEVIDTNRTGSCKSNYHVTTMAPVVKKLGPFFIVGSFIVWTKLIKDKIYVQFPEFKYSISLSFMLIIML
jgi:hypothetical protein